jgi:terminase, large subunit
MPGRFEAFAYQRGWLDAITDPNVRQVTVQKSARVGYTRCLDHAVGYFIHQDPSPVLFVMPRIEDCEDFSRSEILPMLTDTPVLAELVGDIKTRDANQRILKRQFRNGASVAFVGANSPAGFRRISARVVLFDEVDGFPLEAGFEGDQIALGIKRTETFWNRKIVVGSTPTLKFQSRIEKAFADSDQRYFRVACPGCGHYQVLRWENLRWDKTNAGVHLPKTAHFVCERNGCVIEERHKPAMIASGRWVAEKPFTGHAGFHLWTAYSLFPNASWQNIATEFLAAHKDPILLRTFTNTTLGEVFEESSSGRPPEELARRAAQSGYKRGTVPEGALLLFLGIDCQVDRCEWVLLSYGRNYRRFFIDIGTVGGHISELDTQHQIDQLMNRKWPNLFRRRLGISLTAIDANYETDTVLAFAKKYSASKLISIRGRPGDAVPRLARVARERDEKRGVPLHFSGRFYNLGVDQFKAMLYRDLGKDDAAGLGYVNFPNDLPDRFYQELVSENRVAIKRMGQTVFRWVKPERAANECLDCTIYASAAALKYGVHRFSDEYWRQLREDLEIGAPPDPDQPKKRPSLAGRLAS